MAFNEQCYQNYLNSLAESTRNSANRVVAKYLDDCEEAEPPLIPSDVNSVVKWIEILHNEDELASATIWSYLSHINAWFEFGSKIIVKDQDPTIKRLLKLWEKKESTKKASVC